VRNRCGGAAPLDPDELEKVDLPPVGSVLEPCSLRQAELGCLVEDNAGGLVAVGTAVLGEGVVEQLAGVGPAQVGPPVGLGDLRGPAACPASDTALSTNASALNPVRCCGLLLGTVASAAR
jgi:hypothetical protein